MKKCLVVIDMQVDFVTGALGTPEAVRIVPAVCSCIRQAAAEKADILYTMDTHTDGYLSTAEGKKLPVTHCLRGTPGWALCPEVQACLPPDAVKFEKPAFGSRELFEYAARHGYDQIELCGLCTDICVISNAMGLKAFLPEAEITVCAAACAGVTPESHENALRSMRACQIEVEVSDVVEKAGQNFTQMKASP